MKIISIYSLKGGVGKTTISYQLLNSLKIRGYSAVGVDMDRRRGLSDLLVDSDIESYQVEGVLEKADFSDFDCDYIVIDGTPEVSDNILKSMAISDYMIIPVIPNQVDLNVLMSELSQIFFAKLHEINPILKISLLINGITQYDIRNVSDLKQIILTELDHIIPSLNKKLPIIGEIGRRTSISIKSKGGVFDTNNFKAKNEILYLTDKIIEVV